MPLSVRQGGTWKEAQVWVRQGGTWKQADVHVREGGTWKLASASVTYTPVPGTYSASDIYTVSYTLTASVPVVWTFSLPPNVTATITSGTSATSVTFTLPAQPPVNVGESYVTRTRTVNVTATASGQASTFNLNLTALGD